LLLLPGPARSDLEATVRSNVMKYIYGLYDRQHPGTLRYIGQTDNPPRRLRNHWNSRRQPPNENREWEHRLSEWIKGLDSIPIMKILIPVDDSEADRAEHDAIVEARDLYGTGQILNDNAGVSNRVWFRNIMSGPDIRVNVEASSSRAAIVPESDPLISMQGKNAKKRSIPAHMNPSGHRDAPVLHIRQWAIQHGYDVGDRGRLSPHIIADYEAAMAS
jgi:Lsr2